MLFTTSFHLFPPNFVSPVSCLVLAFAPALALALAFAQSFALAFNLLFTLACILALAFAFALALAFAFALAIALVRTVAHSCFATLPALLVFWSVSLPVSLIRLL